ncbi:MAG: DUF2066 domain-containing protein [Parvibaculum sp.]
MLSKDIWMHIGSRVAAILLGLAMVGIPAGGAMAGDVFTVRSVSIDATAENATAARDAAVQAGQLRALDQLLKRLTLPDDWAQLPQVDAALAQGMVRSFQVAGEKRSGTRYLAELSVRFQPGSVRSLLSARSIPIAEAQARPAVLVTLFTSGNDTKLWNEGNLWNAAWGRQDLQNGLAPLTIPLGDLGDISALNVDQTLAGDRAALSALASRYSADRVIVAHATAGAAAGEISAKIVTYPAGEGAATAWNGSENAPSTETGAYRLAAAFLEKLEADWKRSSIVRSSDRAILSASVVYNSLGEWQTIRTRLAQIPPIRSVNMVAVSAGGAQVELDYAGTVDTLELNLAQQNLALTNLDGYWYLAITR